jgi:hypothetical protein
MFPIYGTLIIVIIYRISLISHMNKNQHDNQSGMKFTENLVFHDRSKPIDIKYHYIWNMVERSAVELQYISMDKQIVEILTKPLSSVKYEYFRDKLGVLPNVHPR